MPGCGDDEVMWHGGGLARSMACNYKVYIGFTANLDSDSKTEEDHHCRALAVSPTHITKGCQPELS